MEAGITTLKTFPYDGEVYNIGAFTASTGSWLTLRLMRAFREYISTLDNDGTESDPEAEEPENFAEDLIQMLLSNLPENDFATVQRHALSVVSCTQTIGERTFEQPLVLKNGLFANKELTNNIPLILALTSQVMFANLKPFFTKTGLKAVMKGEQVSSR